MLFKSKKLSLLLCGLFLLSSVITGCGGSEPAGDQQGKQTADNKHVKLLYVEWACASATTHVAAEILENKMGYTVDITPVSAALMYEGLQNQDGDAILCSWLPITHANYMEQVKDKVENLGPNLEGAKLALVVPEYVTINSIEEMNGVKDKFNGEIIGIDPGAGIMGCAEKAIQDYDLDYNLIEGSDATMTAALKSAIDKNEWVVVTGWIPHWKFARWDLKTLEDPKKSFGEAEHIDTIVRQGLKNDMPEVYEFLDNFKWTPDQLSSAMILATEEGVDSKSAASKWVAENPDLVNSWLPEKYQSK